MYEDILKPCFAGMKADSGDDRVETFPAAAAIPFGAIVGVKANGTIEKGKQTRAIGVAVHSHAVANKEGGYVQYDAVSVMSRGLVWALAATADASQVYDAVKFNANGEVDSTASETLKGALVRDVKIVNGKRIILVECHAPTA